MTVVSREAALCSLGLKLTLEPAHPHTLEF
jgi:hypothetical protein